MLFAIIQDLKPKHDQDKSEFLLHLYDALWENMRSKENRLWTFLSIYGAAVGLLFAGGQASQVAGAELFALIIIVALSVWAVLIVLNANWWYCRNQLIVSRIEKRFPNAVKGVIPTPYYQDPGFRYDALSQSSILVLGFLLFFLYSRTLWPYHSAESIETSLALFAVALLYLLFVCSTGYSLRQHERYVWRYYSAKKDLLKVVDELTPQVRLEVHTLGSSWIESGRIRELVSEAVEVARSLDNVYLETSIVSSDLKAQILAKAPVSKLLIGTDFPILAGTHWSSLQFQEEQLIRFGLRASDIERIHQNAMSFFKGKP